MNAEAVALIAIAVATVVMALIQVGVMIYASRLATRLEALVGRVEREVQPAIERLTAMSAEGARAAGLAAAQVERVDRMLTDLGRRADATVTVIQRNLTRPAREGAALVAAVRAATLTLKELRQRRRRAPGQPLEDDDALFIG